ncbi:PBP1A family penicillin-binding protein [Candidatus Saccharibacteria bacterium]|nr:PBP1A family penicillin-binding protein [Candidatus Saccharibacteria bacterium]
MKRQGRYTKKPRHIHRSKSRLRRMWIGFWRMSFKKKLLVIGLPIIAFLIITPLVTYALLWRDIADPERLMNRSNTGVELLDASGQVFYSTGTSKPLNRLKLSEISKATTDALVSSEDKDFYKHSGVSLKGLVAALYANFTSRDATAYGGSTITQQLVKNKLLTANKTFFRKYQEVAMAIAVDRQYSKDDILEMYINSVYFGEGAFGIDEAAHTYFGKAPKDLNLAEASMLIGLLPAPSAYSPVSGDAATAKKQQERVLRRMVEDKKITSEQRDQASAVILTYAPPKASASTVAPHFVEMVIAELEQKYGEEAVTRSGYRVTTTLNLSWQKQVEQIVRDRTIINARSGGRNAALVAIDPRSGAIRSLVGSADYQNTTWGKYNVATGSRQPGSTFKPIYFAEALNQRLITPATILRDEATDFGGGYKPTNFDFRYRGDMTVRSALAQSINIPAVKVMEKLGVSASIEAAQRMGLGTINKDSDYGLSLAIGSAEVKPIEITNAYAAFASGGLQYATTTIQSIEDKYGAVIYQIRPQSRRVQSEQASYLISHMLSDNSARAPSFGSSLTINGRTIAVKTGSTNDNRDAWTIGYTPSIAAGVWVGNNENEPMNAGGAPLAGPIWRQVMVAILGSSPREEFVRPAGIIDAAICRDSGKRATGNATNTYTEVFLSGTVPTESCTGPIPTVEPTPATPVVSDADGDGITDDNDLCPNTPTGSPVTSGGCPSVSAKDTDADGVVDEKDACANTSAGVTVDATGCPMPGTDPPPLTNVRQYVYA